MAIVIFYHFGHYKCFKYFYQQGVLIHLKSYFPDTVSYNRFIELKKEVNIALYFFIFYTGLGRQTGTYYVDSTKMEVCDNHRIYQHRVDDFWHRQPILSWQWNAADFERDIWCDRNCGQFGELQLFRPDQRVLYRDAQQERAHIDSRKPDRNHQQQ